MHKEFTSKDVIKSIFAGFLVAVFVTLIVFGSKTLHENWLGQQASDNTEKQTQNAQ